jgi:DNA ligase (NAD+)
VNPKVAAAARERAATLRQQIDQANHAYYVLDAPTIPDAEYDRLFRELQALEAAHPELQSSDSPTLRVGATPATALARHTHARPMLSLANAFAPEELVAWEERNARLAAGVRTAGYALEIKIDGAAVSLTYEHGRFLRGTTRGNGLVGEDITPNLRTIHDIPLRLKGTGHPALMEVRGEVYLPFRNFERVNREREEAGEPVFANPRNSASGGLRALDPEITRRRRLRMFAFTAEVIDGKPVAATQHGLLERLEEWGFQVEPHHSLAASMDEVQEKVATLAGALATLPFAADGVVVKVDRLTLQSELGTISDREPRWAIARKFAPEVAVTRLRRIRINVGRTGALSPWAELEPVELAGVTISRATLHNEDVIAQKDIREGDWVEVVRAGEVIPQVLGPLRERRDGSEEPFAFPDHCPVCGTAAARVEEEAVRFCPNIACPSRVLEGIVHYAGRGAMDIRGLGYERVRQLLDAGLIRDVADLYQLEAAALMELDRFATQSAEQLVQAIENSKAQPLSLLLFGLGIRHVGKQVAQTLARHFGSLDAIMAASRDDIDEVPGVGSAIGDAVADFFGEERNRAVMERLRKAGLTFTEPRAATSDGPLIGLSIVLTGTLPTLSRARATELIENAGGKVASAVTKKTSFLVAGDEAGSKLDKAKKLGVEILDEAELLRRLGVTP